MVFLETLPNVNMVGFPRAGHISCTDVSDQQNYIWQLHQNPPHRQIT